MKHYKQYNQLDKKTITDKINYFLEEDLTNQDITTQSTVDNSNESKADIIAMENLVFSGVEIIPHFFDCNVEINFNDGDLLSQGEVIGTITGNSQSILSRERVMLNIIQRLCGIATHTKQYVDLAKPFNVKGAFKLSDKSTSKRSPCVCNNSSKVCDGVNAAQSLRLCGITPVREICNKVGLSVI